MKKNDTPLKAGQFAPNPEIENPPGSSPFSPDQSYFRENNQTEKEITVLTHSTFFSGWTTLIGLMMVYAGWCGNVTYAYGVFLPVMSENFRWSRSALSGAYSLFFLIGGLLGPLAGAAVARLGARKTIILAGTVAALGLLGMSRVQAVWQAFFFFGLLAGVGIGFGEFIPITTTVNHWFVRKRSMAMGFLFASGGIGGFILPPLISRLISAFGWRWVWALLGGLHLFLVLVLGGFLIRNRPEEVGQRPDGGPVSGGPFSEVGKTKSSPVYQSPVDWSVQEALTRPVLWSITFLFSIILFASAMMTTHQVAYLQDLGYSPFWSAASLGMMIGMSILGRLASGFLGLRYESRYLAAFFLTAMGTGIVVLTLTRNLFMVFLYSTLTGIGFGGMIVLMPNWISAYFGRENYSRIIGWTSLPVTLISAAGPTVAGLLYEITGSYLAPFALAAGLLFLSVFPAVMARPPKRSGDRSGEF